MKKLRSHRFSYLLLSIMLSITMLVPAQELMLWCDMMDSSKEATSESISLFDDIRSESNEHCDSEVNNTSSEQKSHNHCDELATCDCLEIQSGIQDQAFVFANSVKSDLVLSVRFLELVESFEAINETIPPPIWSFSSYSPPDLFLANASFLI